MTPRLRPLIVCEYIQRELLWPLRQQTTNGFQQLNAGDHLMSLYRFTLTLGVALAALLIYGLLFVGRRARHLPPGPPTLPVIGNAHQIPSKGAHYRLTEWAKQYGGIYSLKLGPGTAIVLTDRRLVREILDKRSAVSSGRPMSTVAQKLIGSDDHLLVMDYGPKWRDMRKLIQQELTAAACEREYVELQEAEAAQMLRNFVEAPDRLMDHPKRFSNSVIMSISKSKFSSHFGPSVFLPRPSLGAWEIS